MSGPNPPDEEPGGQPTDEYQDDLVTDTGFHRAYSAPEVEQYTVGPLRRTRPSPLRLRHLRLGARGHRGRRTARNGRGWWVSPRSSPRSHWWSRCRCWSPAPTPTSLPLPRPPPPSRSRRCRTRSPPPLPPPPPPAAAEHRGTAATAATHRDGDGDAGSAATPTTARYDGGAAASDHHDRSAADHDDHHHHTGRAAAGHLLGDRHEGSRRHHHGDVCRRLGASPHPAQRLHPVVADGDADLASPTSARSRRPACSWSAD